MVSAKRRNSRKEEPTLAATTGWDLDKQERRDFYHRVRTFPDAVGTWRKETVKTIKADHEHFTAVGNKSSLAEVRGCFDEGVSYLREVTRVLSLLQQEGQKKDLGQSLDKDVMRVFARLGPYRELGLALDDAPPAQRKSLVEMLIPPPLRRCLAQNLKILGKSHCKVKNPACESCGIRNFCKSGRQLVVESARRSDAPTFIDLFSGAGGLTEGFKRAGMRPVLALDKEPMALRTYWLNHPEVPQDQILCEDIRSISGARLKKLAQEGVDVLLAAPPCQGFSSAGFRSKRSHSGYRETDDERNFLFEEMVRIATALKPKLILLENVPGMGSVRNDDTSFLETAAQMLQEKGNYKTAVWKLNAAAFGVPQDRVRCFLVASRLKALPVRPEQEYQDTTARVFDEDALPRVTLDEAIFDLPLRDADAGEGVERIQSERSEPDRRERRFLKKFKMRSKTPLVFNHTVRYHNDRDLELYSLLEPGEDSIHFLEKHGRDDLMRYRRDVFDDKYARLRPDQPCKTIVAHLAKDGNSYVHPSQVRSISFREGARVQTFHDGYAFCGSPSDQWIQLGNAVPPLLGEAIGRTFLERLKR